MNSNTRGQLMMAGLFSALLLATQIPSHRKLRTLERQVQELHVQLAQQQAGQPQPALAAVAPAAPRIAQWDELLNHARQPAEHQYSQAAFEAWLKDEQRHNRREPVQTAASAEPQQEAHPQLAMASDRADGLQVMTEDELAGTFAGAGAPSPMTIGGAQFPANQNQGLPEEPVKRLTSRVERGGVLLPRGKMQVEPTFSYSHVSSNRVGLSGVSIFDVIFIGEIRSDEIDRDIFTSSLNARYGITKNLEAEAEIPMQYQRKETLSGPIANRQQNTETQAGFSDMAGGLFYQFMREEGSRPGMIAHLRVKAPTGSTPALGSGAWSTKAALTMVKTSDPVVLFTNVGYNLNFPADINGVQVNPGDSFEYSAGIAYALNYKLALNGSFEQIFVGQSQSNGSSIAGSRLVVANLKAGLTYALTKQLALDFSVGAGLTADSPDLTVTFSLPYTF